jgi:D-alanyl-D-alanine carboxypeptidase
MKMLNLGEQVSTKFVEPTGLSPDNWSSPYDML